MADDDRSEIDRECRDIFGLSFTEAARDRRTEGWARRSGGPIPDMRRGTKGSPTDTTDTAGDALAADPSRSALSGIDRAEVVAERLLLGEPSVPTERQKTVTSRTGRKSKATVALIRDEYERELAKLAAKKAAPRKAPPSPEPTPANTGTEIPARLRGVAEEARQWSAKQKLGRRSPFVDLDRIERRHPRDREDSDWDRYRWHDEEIAAVLEELDGPDATTRRLRNRGRYGTVRPTAEEEYREGAWLLRQSGHYDPHPDVRFVEPSPTCAHCGIDSVQTKRDGLCRWCKQQKKRTGHLPSVEIIDHRRQRGGPRR